MILKIAARRLGIRLDVPKCAAGDKPGALTADVEALNRIQSPHLPEIRKLRRRLLTKRGARMLVSMVERNDPGMLAILDAHGVVVYWHDGAVRGDQTTQSVLNRHVSQFYVPEIESVALANNHLCQAFASGGSLAAGWRRRSDGSVFWGVTQIEPLLLADGRLQGFTHVTRTSSEPREPVVLRVQRRLKMRRWTTSELGRAVAFHLFPRSARIAIC